MKNSKLKITVFFVWLIGIIGFVTFQKSVNAEAISTIPKPDLKEVEKFNSLILERFLTEPQFGGRRIITSDIHLQSFAPKNDAEKSSVNYFEQKGWKMGIYLFGKRYYYGSYFITNKPISVTKQTETDDLPNGELILSDVAKAFYDFQEDEKSNDRKIEFTSDDWWYFAKPVRAVNESCVKCHQDTVQIREKGTNKYTLRPRQIGDVNGVLVYAFQKVK